MTWQGIVKNIEYLGLDDGVKKVMGKWWRRWIKTERGREGRGGPRRASAGDVLAGPKSKWKRKSVAGVDEVAGVDGWESEEGSKGGEEEEEEEEEMCVDEGFRIHGMERGVSADDGGVSGLLRAL